jgi:hypothetical protein
MAEKTKIWKSCGYLSKSKNPKVFVVMVKHQRFIVNLDGLEEVKAGKIEYTLIYEHIGNDLKMTTLQGQQGKLCVDCETVLEDNGFCPDCKKFMTAIGD